METADLVLAIIVPVIVLAAGWLGVEMGTEEDLSQAKRFWYRLLFIVLGLVAIGLNIWQTSRNVGQQQQVRREADKTEKELSNQLSAANGKLDAISSFEKQFLTFVSEQRPTSPDAATKAYEALAIAVLKTAQGQTTTSSPPDAHLQILYEKGELDGQTILIAVTPGAANLLITIPEFRFRNTGGRVSGVVSARLYFSRVINGIGNWMATESDEPSFPSAFYAANTSGVPVTI